MPRAYDLDFAKLPDEILVVFAQCGCRPARATIAARRRAEVDGIAHVYLAKVALPPDCGRKDVKQQAFLSLDLAITEYDTDQLGRRDGLSFRRFLYKVVMARLHNFLRAAWRRERKLDRRVDATLAADDQAARRRRSADDDPAEMLTRKETFAALHEAVADLDKTQALVKLVLTGMNHTQAGRELGLSEDATRWRWQKAVKVLRKKMGKYWEDD